MPTRWTKDVVRQGVARAATSALSRTAPGRKAQALCQPFSPQTGTFGPQLYICFEVKPASTARARLRLDVALTPAVLHRYNKNISPRCNKCPSKYADRGHLLLHCPHYSSHRLKLWEHGHWHLSLNQILGSVHDTPLTIPARKQLLLLSAPLILAITEDLPKSLNKHQHVL